jgi:4-diphosphocytidyl-2-C-methyl-D-erythritol kinase
MASLFPALILHQSLFPVIFSQSAVTHNLLASLNPERLRAYAKINLGLFIREKRPDGYHNIETVFHRIDLFDEISLSESDEVSVVSTDVHAPGDESNICYKAAMLLRQHLGARAGVRISIQKNIPVGAGLGGGSSDAATVLRSLPQFWGRTIDDETLHELALQLGSDVPYFLHQGTAVGRGRGDILEYFDLDIPFSTLLCYPNVHVSTAWAYQHAKASKPWRRNDLKRLLIDGMKTPSMLVSDLLNDFEPIVFREFPAVMRLKEAMMRGGAEFSLMSGSGSSVFGLFSRQQAALAVEEKLREQGWLTFQTGPHFLPMP